MNIRFETLKPDHLPEIESIYNWYVLNSTATFHTNPIGVEQLKEIIYINHPRYKSYVIMSDNVLAGYCYLTRHKPREAYDRTAEITIYLKPEFQRKGIGHVALSFLENQAVAVGIRNLIGGISGDNIGSIALFERAGFVKCAHYKNVGEKFGKILDVVAYQKELN